MRQKALRNLTVNKSTKSKNIKTLKGIMPAPLTNSFEHIPVVKEMEDYEYGNGQESDLEQYMNKDLVFPL